MSPYRQWITVVKHTERTRNVMFPSSKKKCLCRVNRLISVDCIMLVSVDSTGELDGWKEILSPMIPLDKSDGAAMMVSEETTVDANGESGPVIKVVWGCWAIMMSRPGCTYGHILPALQMGRLLVDDLHEQDQQLYDRLTSHERQFPAVSIETSSWRTHCGHRQLRSCGGRLRTGRLESQQGIVLRYSFMSVCVAPSG